jgi:hypothetical protein
VAVSQEVFSQASDQCLAKGGHRDTDEQESTTRDKAGPNVELVKYYLDDGYHRQRGDERDQAELPYVVPPQPPRLGDGAPH